MRIFYSRKLANNFNFQHLDAYKISKTYAGISKLLVIFIFGYIFVSDSSEIMLPKSTLHLLLIVSHGLAYSDLGSPILVGIEDCDCDCSIKCDNTFFQPECGKDILILVDTSFCMQPQIPRIVQTQIELVQVVADNFGYGKEGTARVGLMLDSYCYPRGPGCDPTTVMPFGFDSFIDTHPDYIVEDMVAEVRRALLQYPNNTHILDNALADAYNYFTSKSGDRQKHLAAV